MIGVSPRSLLNTCQIQYHIRLGGLEGPSVEFDGHTFGLGATHVEQG